MPSVWTEVVIPLIEVKNTALIAISTPLDSSNFYSTLISMKDETGNKVFEVYEGRAACAKCVETLEDPSKCPHVQLERPAWKSKEKQKVVKALYAGNEQTMLRESMGVVTEGANGVFMRKMVQQVFDQPKKPIPPDTSHIFVAIDPNGGGPSHFAICSVIRHHGQLLVLAYMILFTPCRYHYYLLISNGFSGHTIDAISVSRVAYKRLYLKRKHVV